MDARQKEVDRNYEAFEKLLPSLVPQYGGQFALMKDGKILGFYSTPRDARAAADLAIRDDLFSIQQVTSMPIDLGFYTYAMPISSV